MAALWTCWISVDEPIRIKQFHAARGIFLYERSGGRGPCEEGPLEATCMLLAELARRT